jgi:hypothetical protein
MRHLQDEKVLTELRVLQPKTEQIVEQLDHDRFERVMKRTKQAKEATKSLPARKHLSLPIRRTLVFTSHQDKPTSTLPMKRAIKADTC